MAALVRHRDADDPQVVQARDDYADFRTRAQLQRLTPAERRRLLAALVDDREAMAA
jgi:hypothetical protein